MNYTPSIDLLKSLNFSNDVVNHYWEIELANECSLAVDLSLVGKGLLLFGPMSLFPDTIYRPQNEPEFMEMVTRLVEQAKTTPVTYTE